MVDGHPSRSVLPLVATLRRRRCDVLLIGTADTSAYARQSVLTDLPNALQLLKGRGLLILHGHDGDECKPAVVDAAPHLWSARQVAAARRRTSHGMVGCPAGVAAGLMCATPGYWCRYWEQLVQAGSIVRPECRGDTPTGMRSCAGELLQPSRAAMKMLLVRALSVWLWQLFTQPCATRQPAVGRRGQAERPTPPELYAAERRGYTASCMGGGARGKCKAALAWFAAGKIAARVAVAPSMAAWVLKGAEPATSAYAI